ncbi:MAG: UDP-N-acetylmuramoyl-L-alanyl-D-glutamate--2,6-diaminopimelate ligase [Patescibacteria group bacterium]
MKTLIRKLIPKNIINLYHRFLATLAAIFYNFPSRKLYVIGVTGTTGKTTVCNLIGKVLEEAGFKVGIATTANFKIANKEWINDTKQTMQGRFRLQKLLKKMVKEGCRYAVIETSSEGIAQNRHLFIDYSCAVFTNLTPEHIESHGSFEKYKEAKAKLFKSLVNPKSQIPNPKQIQNSKFKIPNKKVIIANLDDLYAEYFLGFEADEKWGYGANFQFPISNFQLNSKFQNLKIIKTKNIQISPKGTKFFINNQEFSLKLLGEFNVYNALAAICAGRSQNVPMEKIKIALEKFRSMPGRMEKVEGGQDFLVFVDYAHEPAGLESVYQTLKEIKKPQAKIISVLGSCGGGRDRAKRPTLGKLAAKYADYVIITNEDPYDEDSMSIIEQVAFGVAKEKNREENKNFWRILDREEAIKKAILMAKKDDIVILTGKGSEQCIMGKSGKKIPWDERKVARKILEIHSLSDIKSGSSFHSEKPAATTNKIGSRNL